MHPILDAPMRTRHILLSYPLGQISLLTFFASNTYSHTLSALIRDPEAHVLILFGDRDEFTASGKYITWTAQLCEEANDWSLQISCIEGANHFWAASAIERMHIEVSTWLENSASSAHAAIIAS